MTNTFAILAFSFRPELPGLRGMYWAIPPLVVIAAVYFAGMYHVDARTLTPARKRILWTLRTVAAGLVLLMLLTPAVQLVKTEERLPVVAILVDGSTSMNYPEAAGQPLLEGKAKNARTRYHAAIEALDQLQRELSKTHRVKVYTFSDTVQLAKDIPNRAGDSIPAVSRDQLLANLPTPTGGYTEAGEAVGDVMEKLSDEKISSIVLLSDGRNTGGKPLSAAGEQAAQAGVRVQALAFGSEDPLTDLRIDRVDAPGEASLSDNLTIYVQIANYVKPNLKCTLKLFEKAAETSATQPSEPEKLDQEKTFTLAKGRNDIALMTIPRTEGLREYHIVLPRFEDEINYENNEATFHVKVIKRTLRVLFVAGKATREYEHAVLCMMRDPVIRLSCYLQSAHIDYVQQGHIVIDKLPSTIAQWAEYDVVVLYDIDPKDISSQQMSGLENTVNKGAGMLMVAGRTYGMGPLLQIHANKLRQMLPVEIDKNRPPRYEVVFDKPITVERTAEGRASPVFQLVANEKDNEAIWASFPQLYWYHPVMSAKPQAIVTLRKTAGPDYLDDAGDCIMAFQRFGEGLVTYLGTDEIWRWRNPYGSYDYDLFWTHLVRYLGETRLLGAQKQVALSTDKQIYSPGEKAKVKLQILDPALLQQLTGEQLSATVIDPDKARQVIALERDPAGGAFYQGSYPTRHTGPHVIEAHHALSTSDTEAKNLFDISEGFRVEIVPLESLDTTADLEDMEKLAAATGGMSLDHRTMDKQALNKLAASIPTDKLKIDREVVKEIWDGWVVLVAILALVTTEWTLRRMWGVL